MFSTVLIYLQLLYTSLKNSMCVLYWKNKQTANKIWLGELSMDEFLSAILGLFSLWFFSFFRRAHQKQIVDFGYHRNEKWFQGAMLLRTEASRNITRCRGRTFHRLKETQHHVHGNLP